MTGSSPAEATTGRRVLFACDLDSQIFGALPIALAFRARGWRATFAIDAARRPSPSVLERLGGRFELIERSLGALAVSDEMFDYDAVGVYATGSRLALFRRCAELSAHVIRRPRPALFCGFNGIVLGRFEEGVSWRFGYDRICLNGPRDRDGFAAFTANTAFAAQPTVLTGLRRRPDEVQPKPRRAPEDGRRRVFVFAEQVAVPADPRRRVELMAGLARLAARSPDWDVIVKARVRPAEQTFHEQTRHIQQVIDRLKSRPANLSISYEALDRILDRADLFGTISSTAIFDALDRSVPIMLVSDFGVRNAHGTHVTFGSGVATRIDDLASLEDAPRRAPDRGWLDRVGYGPDCTPDALIDLLAAFDSSAPLPPALYAFDEAARGAAPSADRARAVIAARDKVELALAEGRDAGAELGALGEALEASDRQRAIDEAWRTSEGRLARLARRFGFYAPYKRLRSRLIGEAPK